jgi:hypothetical protein
MHRKLLYAAAGAMLVLGLGGCAATYGPYGYGGPVAYSESYGPWADEPGRVERVAGRPFFAEMDRRDQLGDPGHAQPDPASHSALAMADTTDRGFTRPSVSGHGSGGHGGGGQNGGEGGPR